MTTHLATGVAMILYVVPLLPIALAGWRSSLVPAVGTALGAAVVALAFTHTGLLQRNSLASTDVNHMFTADAIDDRCDKVLDVLVEAGIVIDRPGAQGLIVSGESWDQVPPAIQQFVLECVQEFADTDVASEPVPLIRR